MDGISESDLSSPNELSLLLGICRGGDPEEEGEGVRIRTCSVRGDGDRILTCSFFPSSPADRRFAFPNMSSLFLRMLMVEFGPEGRGPGPGYVRSSTLFFRIGLRLTAEWSAACWSR